MSNLEPGCKAIIVGGRCKENLGKMVTVGGFIGRKILDGLPSGDSDLWEVDQPILFRTTGIVKESMRYLCSGSTMQRIDDHDTNLIESKKELETVY